jgi:hypothetical protein
VQLVSGTGLGLAIVSSLVQMHGGRLSVDPAAGWAAFSFTLPVLAEEPAADWQPRPSVAEATGGLRRQRPPDRAKGMRVRWPRY